MEVRELLFDLNAAAVTMHVAKSADVHENVEAKCLAGGEETQQLVVLASMAHTESDNFFSTRRGNR